MRPITCATSTSVRAIWHWNVQYCNIISNHLAYITQYCSISSYIFQYHHYFVQYCWYSVQFSRFALECPVLSRTKIPRRIASFLGYPPWWDLLVPSLFPSLIFSCPSILVPRISVQQKIRSGPFFQAADNSRSNFLFQPDISNFLFNNFHLTKNLIQTLYCKNAFFVFFLDFACNDPFCAKFYLKLQILLSKMEIEVPRR